MRILRNEFLWISLILVGLFFSSAMPYSDQSLVSPLERIDWSWIEPTLETIQFDYASTEVSLEAKGTVGLIEFLLRKTAHFTIFFVLGALFVKAVSRTDLQASLVMLFAWTLTNTVAIFDEFHQSLTPERTPLVQDVLLDNIGAIFGVVFVGGLYLWKRSGKQQNRARFVRLS